MDPESANPVIPVYLAALERFSAREVRMTSRAQLESALSLTERRSASSQWQRLQASGVSALHLDDSGFPNRLREIPDPPAVIFFRGNPKALDRRCVAVIGARRASPSGIQTAKAVSRALASRQVTVVSGLALGIDAAAHRAALEARGSTVAVFGCGLLHTYPAVNAQLAERIHESDGLLLSEYHPNQSPRKHFFPERNRIISGLCETVIVVEAGDRSGSLITARMALEQGREVLAVPGSIHDERSRGCHRLIREGAGLLDSMDTLFEELGLEPEARENTTPEGISRLVWDVLSPDEPLPLDVIADRSGVALADIALVLLELEVAGFVDADGGGYSRRVA